EAETYRDRNAAELRLVYQKRQHDKERKARGRFHAVVFALCGILVLAGISVWALRERAKANEQARQANNERRRADLQISDRYFEKGAESEAECEADDRDTSGAFLWYAAGWSKFQPWADSHASGDTDRLHARYLLQLTTARERLPFLAGMAYQQRMLG